MRREKTVVFLFLMTSMFVMGSLPFTERSSGRDIKGGLGPAYAEPEIDIIMSPASYQVNVQPGEDGFVNMFGTVRCEMPSYMPPNVYCIVTLSVDAGEWTAYYPPDLMFSKQVVERTFTASVQVPIGSSPDESRDVFISGRWSYSPGVQGGTTETESVHVEVLPYVFLAYKTEMTNRTIEIGETGTVTVEIENQGTQEAMVTLMIRSDSELMQVDLDKKTMTIPPHQTEEVTITFKQSSGKGGIFTITLMADDPEHGNPSAVRFTFKVFTKEKGFLSSSTRFIVPIGTAAAVILLGAGSVFLIMKLRKRRRSRIG